MPTDHPSASRHPARSAERMTLPGKVIELCQKSLEQQDPSEHEKSREQVKRYQSAYDALFGCASKHSSELVADEVSAIVCVLQASNIKWSLLGKFMPELLGAIQRHFEDFEGKRVGSVISGLGHSGILWQKDDVDESFKQDYFHFLNKSVNTVNTAFSLSVSLQGPSHLLHILVLSFSAFSRMYACWLDFPEHYKAHCFAAIRELAPVFKAMDIASFILSCSKIGLSWAMFPPDIQRLLEAAFLRNAFFYNAQELANVILGAANIRVSSDDIRVFLVKNINRVISSTKAISDADATDQRNKFRGQYVVSIFSGLVGLRVSPLIFKAPENHEIRRLVSDYASTFDARGWSHMLRSLSKFGTTLDNCQPFEREWLRCFFKSVSNNNCSLGAAEPEAIAVILSSIESMGFLNVLSSDGEQDPHAQWSAPAIRGTKLKLLDRVEQLASKFSMHDADAVRDILWKLRRLATTEDETRLLMSCITGFLLKQRRLSAPQKPEVTMNLPTFFNDQKRMNVPHSPGEQASQQATAVTRFECDQDSLFQQLMKQCRDSACYGLATDTTRKRFADLETRLTRIEEIQQLDASQLFNCLFMFQVCGVSLSVFGDPISREFIKVMIEHLDRYFLDSKISLVISTITSSGMNRDNLGRDVLQRYIDFVYEKVFLPARLTTSASHSSLCHQFADGAWSIVTLGVRLHDLPVNYREAYLAIICGRFKEFSAWDTAVLLRIYNLELDSVTARAALQDAFFRTRRAINAQSFAFNCLTSTLPRRQGVEDIVIDPFFETEEAASIIVRYQATCGPDEVADIVYGYCLLGIPLAKPKTREGESALSVILSLWNCHAAKFTFSNWMRLLFALERFDALKVGGKLSFDLFAPFFKCVANHKDGTGWMTAAEAATFFVVMKKLGCLEDLALSQDQEGARKVKLACLLKLLKYAHELDAKRAADCGEAVTELKGLSPQEEIKFITPCLERLALRLAGPPVAQLPQLPQWPQWPQLLQWSQLPQRPQWSQWSQLPQLPQLPQWSQLPQRPQWSQLPVNLPTFFNQQKETRQDLEYYRRSMDKFCDEGASCAAVYDDTECLSSVLELVM